MTDKKECGSRIYIKVTKDGPYFVYGMPPIRQEFITDNKQGNSWEYTKGEDIPPPCKDGYIALCRCGKSKNAPFCDGTHASEGFDGTETASHEPILNNAVVYDGDNLTLYDNEAYCAFARFCDGFGQVWNLVSQEGELAEKLTIHEATHCPAGRLMVKDKRTGAFIEPDLEKEIGLIEDIKLRVSGPLFVKGGIPIESEDGKTYELRNRQTLCRCGHSKNKPFCDGCHASSHWHDGMETKPKK